jgi:predicted lipoprotein with Yx(FWY)xxD motif
VVACAALIAAGCTSMRAIDAPAQCDKGALTDWHAHMTLYTFDKDGVNPPKSNCNDYCATVWPPFRAQASDRDGGGFTKFKRDDGTLQWAYEGKPLYTFAKDGKVGDKTGDNVNSVWHVATCK